jgi:G3E family GTPase
MKKTNLVVVGGFLGAGKTTSIIAMARYFMSGGRKIGIVTNDQGSRLVDTNFMVSEGLPVLEVTGGCFCCNFDEFTEKVTRLTESEFPDIILAEPVGSCTDLIATIFKPMQLKFTKQFTLCPLSIVADPKRVKRLMMEKGSSPFPDEINYLFRKQLEEADVIVLNKIDLLTDEELGSITSFLKVTFNGIDVIAVSAKEGRGMEEWDEIAASSTSGFNNIRDIDYETYAKAEEYLGWLNSSAAVHFSEAVDANTLIEALISQIREDLEKEAIEIAHLKVYGVSGNDWVKASITSIFENIDFNRKMSNPASWLNLIVNARVNTEPVRLKPVVENALAYVCGSLGADVKDLRTECFKPGKPKPKYRMQ